MINNKWLWVGVAVIAVIVVAGGGFYLLNTNQISSSPTPEMTQSPSPASSGNTGSTEESSTMSENEITIEGGEFKFTPSEVKVKKGEKVKITFVNAGSFPHDFVIADLDIATKRINPGEEDTVEFTPEETGGFRIICSVGNHEEQGMVGTLTVEE